MLGHNPVNVRPTAYRFRFGAFVNGAADAARLIHREYSTLDVTSYFRSSTRTSLKLRFDRPDRTGHNDRDPRSPSWASFAARGTTLVRTLRPTLSVISGN